MAAVNPVTRTCLPSTSVSTTSGPSSRRSCAAFLARQSLSSRDSAFRGCGTILAPNTSSSWILIQKKTMVRAHTETEVQVNRAACPPLKPQVDASAVAALDLRVGVITAAKPVHDEEMSAKRGKPTQSRTHLELTVDIGSEVRTLVSECKYVMDVEDAVGKKVLLAANVPPTLVHGIASHGLILTGYNYDPTPMPRSLRVILPGGLGRLPPGSQVRQIGAPE